MDRKKQELVRAFTEFAFSIVICEEYAEKPASKLQKAVRVSKELESEFLKNRLHLKMRVTTLVSRKEESTRDYAELKNQIRAMARDIFKSKDEVNEAILEIMRNNHRGIAKVRAKKVIALIREGFFRFDYKGQST